MKLLKGIGLKLLSALLFALMSGLVRHMSPVVPLGEIVFFRAAFAIVPVLIIYSWRGEIAAAVRTKRPFGQLGRGLLSVGGMFTNFASLARLPLADATAIQFASPLITVALAALVLKERVRLYRWMAVLVGFGGVLIMLAPHLTASQLGASAAFGAALALTAACFNAGVVIQTRRLLETERTPAIVFYFSLICALAGLATLPFAWHTPTAWELAALVMTGIIGGVAHILLTWSYRFAEASIVAPFDYSSMLWAMLIGYLMFGEVPLPLVVLGAVIVAGAGIFVIWRERRLSKKLARQRERQLERERQTPPA